MTDFLDDLLNSKRDGVAIEKHQVIIDKLVAAVIDKANRFAISENPGRIAQGFEAYALKELKKVEVSHFEGGAQTFVVIEVGMIGDEGSMASIFCRDCRHIAISKNGGLTLINCKSKRKSLGFFHAVHALTKN